MNKIINIKQAELKTANVEIKLLTIDSRKVTLSVFRQIKEEMIIDADTMQLKGIPWGWVNYFWGDEKECKSPTSINLIWQHGTELRRGCVTRAKIRKNLYRTPGFGPGPGLAPIDFDLESLQDWEKGLKEIEDGLKGHFHIGSNNDRYTLTLNIRYLGDFDARKADPDGPIASVDKKDYENIPDGQKIEIVRRDLLEILENRIPEYKEEIDYHTGRIKKWNELYDQLFLTDQLFIAI